VGLSSPQRNDAERDSLIDCFGLAGGESPLRFIDIYYAGFRYRLCDPRLPGKPDLVFWGKRKVIFVHGCFWHGHEGCRRNRMPKSNQEYWFSKLEKNKVRDSLHFSKLREMGWQALAVWECELKEADILLERLKTFLKE